MVFTSDNIFHRVHPFLDQALPDKWLDSLDRLAELDAEYFVPGHGTICTPDYIPEMKTAIETWVAVVTDAINKDVCLEEALDTISLLDRYPMEPGNEAMGPELQRMNIRRLYEVLS